MIRWFAEHPTAANIMMLVILLLGIKSLPSLQRETFPQVKNDKVSIVIPYLGAVAEDIEDAICRRLENALESISEIEEMSCEAKENKAQATAEMTEGSDLFLFIDDVKSAVEAINDFPDSVEAAVIEEIGRTDKVISIAITGPKNASTLKAYAEEVKLRLLEQGNISTVQISGFSDHQIRVEINPERLRQYGLSLSDIANAMRDQSISVPAGRLESDSDEILVRFDDQRKTIHEVGQIVVISAKSGAFIRLQDIAEITDQFEDAENKIYFNGERAAILNVNKTKTQDILVALKAVKEFVVKENKVMPEGVKLSLTQDRASVVQDRLDMILGNALQGVLMVFLVLWLFFSFRYSFWVTMGLPVSFLGALFILPYMGMTINMISLVGLLIGVGLLMDDAIVIAENIAAKLEQGEEAIEAAINGTKQVLPGVLSSFATTLMIFGSLAFITGDIGQVLRVMPIVLIIVISVSLVEAFFILPNHLGHSLKKKAEKTPSAFRIAFEKGFDRFRDRFFGALIDKAIRFRYGALGFSIMLFLVALSFPIGGKIKFVGFPATEGDIVEARLLLPQGTPLSLTEERVKKIHQAALEVSKELSPLQPDAQALVANTTIIYAENPDAYESGSHVARVIVDLLGTEKRQTSIDEFRTAWHDKVGALADVISLTFTEPALGPGGRPIQVRIKGKDIEQLKLASYELQNWLRQYQGVINVTDDMRPGKREIRVHLKESAGVLGVNALMVANQIRA
ncbi:MAG: efflux RND transporter permease subunit, partial [Gammaproteobacteria bacterium]|nr:efflux RND transporter permease subunit [Gammaproteobacteria bacterium]